MDPNKYAKNQSIEPETRLKTIKAAVSMLLMLLGLIGIAVEFFRPSGGVVALLEFASASSFNMGLTALIILSLWAFHRYITHAKDSANKKAGNAPMFFMMLIGAYYAVRLITTGGF